MSGQEVIVEFIKVGRVLKVCAICAKTGREVSMVGDPKASQKELERIAINKLKYVMQKEAQKAQAPNKGIVV